ncbi:MAG TPA: DNA-binding protein [Phycisphaerales bacterium]|nr:DNA-binding protein [Phycisphaerales bacterium]
MEAHRPTHEGFITQGELLRMLGMHRSTWHRRCQLGLGLTPVKMGNRNRYPVDAVRALIERMKKDGRM